MAPPMHGALSITLALLLCCAAPLHALAPSRRLLQTVPAAEGATSTSADVLLIGAGMAGITAARQLADTTGLKVILLEARNRSGGRLYSVETTQGRVDQGAMWIHEGFAGNPLYDLAVSLNEPLSLEENYFSGAPFTYEGQPTDFMWTLDYTSHRAAIMEMVDTMKTNSSTNSTDQDVSLGKVYEDYLVSKGLTMAEAPSANLAVHSAFQVLLNANLTDLSTLRYGDAKTLPAIDVLLRNGFDALIDRLKPGLDIRYNVEVSEIAQTPEGVEVITSDGTTYTAKYAITTQTLGCLKQGGVQFSPPLPAWKLEAVENMGMGTFDKVILVYDSETAFWSPEDFILRETPDLTGEWSAFLNYNRTLDMSVLVALNVAETARKLEGMSDEEVLASLMTVLRSMYGQDIPQPKEFYVTRWGEDKYSCGSYSYFATGNEKNITSVLAEPVDRLLFAGEATSEKPATVLGAYLSGQREATRVVELLNAQPVAALNLTASNGPFE